MVFGVVGEFSDAIAWSAGVAGAGRLKQRVYIFD
jgi:hypothetical protein